MISTSFPMAVESSDFQEIVGESSGLRRALELAKKVARHRAPVLILGEAGSGKESIARAIHRLSLRRNESFAKLSCAASTKGMLATELFGQERGAVAEYRKIGQLERADKGILFLDEIGQMALDVQAKLLRFMERREFERNGGTQTLRPDVRLIVTTSHDLGERVAEESFDSELYAKLNAFPIPVPPLRDRREDIPLLADYFMQKFASRLNKRIKSISPETLTALMNFNWPGNVQQLENLIERSVASTEGSVLQVPLAELNGSGKRSAIQL